MALTFTEEQKKEVEARGMTVEQAEMILYKAVNLFQPIFDALWDICKNMSKEQMEEFLKADEEKS